MENGGLIGYSKYKILSRIPQQYLPETLYVTKDKDFAFIDAKLLEKNLKFPLIAKPDQGARGFGVEFIEDTEQLRKYHLNVKFNYLIQEYLDAPMEYGVFVVKTPSEFKVSSIIEKEFLILKGDGRSTLKDLFLNHPRASKYFTLKDLPTYSDRVLKPEESILLEPIGNHCRGTKFVNANALIDDSLTKQFKNLCDQIPDFYYGRFDVKAQTANDLKEGKFKIMELNGASAEPGHIYDPSYTLEQAYADLFWHWRKMSEIAESNRSKYPKESLWQTLKTVKNYYSKR